MQTSLYRYYTAGETLLYIGISHDPFRRETQHLRDKDMARVKHIELEWFPDREAAKVAEDAAIKRERPLWNKAQLAKPRRLAKTPTVKAVMPKAAPARRAKQSPRRTKPRIYLEVGPHEPLTIGPPQQVAIVELSPNREHIGMSHPDLCFDPAWSLEMAVKICRKGAVMVKHPDVDLPAHVVSEIIGCGAHIIEAA